LAKKKVAVFERIRRSEKNRSLGDPVSIIRDSRNAKRLTNPERSAKTLRMPSPNTRA